jgi:hypothetical protein
MTIIEPCAAMFLTGAPEISTIDLPLASRRQISTAGQTRGGSATTDPS